MKHLIAIGFWVTISSVFAQGTCIGTEHPNGQATYYVGLPTGQGNCTFESDSVVPNYAALATGMYNGPGGLEPAKYCGVCVEVTGPKGTATIQIVDQCPTCEHSEQDLDLSPEVFEEIVGPLTIGIGDISWHEVSCPRQHPIYMHIQGSHEWYGKVIIAGHVNRIMRVEVENGPNNWIDLERQEDNGWESNLGGHFSYNFRITDLFGEVLTISNVDLRIGNGVITGTTNFTPCTITATENLMNKSNITAFPNPASDAVVFDGLKGITSFEIVNTNGTAVHKEKIPGYESLRLDLSAFTPGIYVVRFYSKESQIATHRISIQ